MNVLINIDVDDLAQAVQFYTAAFDLRVGRRFGADGVELLGAASPIYLLVKADGSAACCGVGDARTYVRHWTPIHLDFVVADVQSAVQKAVAAGAVVERAAQTHAWGKIAVLADPFGHGFCLIEFIGDGYDAISTE